MKDEELKDFPTEEQIDFVIDLKRKITLEKGFCTDADIFLAGLKEGKPQWHDLEKDPNDLPKDKHNVWCKCLDEYGEGWYDKDTDTWTLIYRGYHVHCIEAWCELPTFDKE